MKDISLLRVCLLAALFTLSLSVSATDYYWIGGSGNWSDISHWATTSGGVTTHSQAPGADDDIYFDGNSFTASGQTVTLNTDIIFCRNMSWAGVTNNPTFAGPFSTTINVFGSWTLDPGMTYAFDGQLLFTGGSDNTVDFANHPAGTTATFSGTGSWTLNGSFSCDSTLTFSEGTLNTNGAAVRCGYFRSVGTSPRTLNLGNSELIVRKGTYFPWPNAPEWRQYQPLRIEATNLSLDAGTSTVELRGSVNSVYFEGQGDLSFNRFILRAPMGDSHLRYWPEYLDASQRPNVDFNELDLFHKTELVGSFDIGNLILHPGQRYIFDSGETFTLNGLQANGTCEAGISITGSENELAASFVTTTSLSADYLSVRSIAATGDFSATNAIDLGNNSGWNFMVKAPEAFYWIGGTGNWNDPTHWSNASGGAASGCVPSIADDVFFDGNSFSGPGQTVTVNVENAGCRNMDWTGATGTPNLSGPFDNQIRITGSLTFIEAMNHDFAGNYVFASAATDNLITSARQHFNRHVDFDGTGAWRLADSFYVHKNMSLLSGTLNTGDQPVNTEYFFSRTNQPRTLILGDSYFVLNTRQEEFYYMEFWLQTQNLTFDAGTSTIEFIGGNSGRLQLEGPNTVDFNVVIYTTEVGQHINSTFPQDPEDRPRFDSLIFNLSGDFAGDHLINYAYFSPGYAYQFSRDSELEVTELDANGSCEEGHISLISYEQDHPGRLALPPGQTFSRLLIRSVHVTDGAPAIATSSVDGGGTVGWDITGDAGRTLYWVGGSGAWYDETHWSLTSGGPGGECVPTPIDDVIFDGNATTEMDLSVSNSSLRPATCRNMSWEADLTISVFPYFGEVRMFGSFTNAAPNVIGQFPRLYLYGKDNHTITSGGAAIFELVFQHENSYTLTDNMRGYGIRHATGEVIYAGDNVDLSELSFFESTVNKTARLNSTHFTLGRDFPNSFEQLFIDQNANLTIEPGNSLIEFDDAQGWAVIGQPVTLHNLLFSDPAGNGRISTYNLEGTEAIVANTTTFYGSGTLDISLTTDSLLLSPGKSYLFKSGITQTITDYWQVIGNNCTPISLGSSQPGQAATARVPATGEILADFVQMRDITGIGGADFLAGARSTDINNSNQNWIFETAPEFREVGFLGEDRALCVGEDLTLDAYNFSPGETYRWQDGSTDSTFTTNQSGIYFVEVTFQTSCVIRDTIEVLDAQAFSVNLPDNPAICAGDTLVLDADAGINSAEYRWQDDSEESSFAATTAGTYFVIVDLGGCIESDTTELTVTELPAADLGQDRIACAGEDFTLTTDGAAESYRWQDNSTGPTFTGDEGGIYWVEARNGNCPVRDSIEISYLDISAIDLGRDTTVCDADQLLLDAGLPGGQYRWQDGSTGQTLTARDTGRYFVEVTVSGCSAADTIEVDFVQPTLPSGSDFTFCEGTEFSFDASADARASNFRWSNGQTGPIFTTSVEGAFSTDYDYRKRPNFTSCPVTIPFTVTEVSRPDVELGDDIMVCENVPVVLTIPQAGVWQDSTVTNAYAVTAPGLYRVIAANGSCVAADSVTVTFLPAPEFSLGEDQVACAEEPLTVAVPTGLGSIRWDDGLSDPQRTFTTPGIRWVDIEDTNGCIGRDSVELSFNAFPSLELGPDTTVCEDETLVLLPNISGGALSWPDGSAGESFSVEGPTATRIIASLTEGGCTTLDSVFVSFTECIDFQAYLPTAFSPNQDGVNDEFAVLFDPRVEVLEYRMLVWSRWGDEIFVSEDPNARWDGTVRGEVQPMGVYLYAIEITYRDDRGVGSEVLKGDITLLR